MPLGTIQKSRKGTIITHLDNSLLAKPPTEFTVVNGLLPDEGLIQCSPQWIELVFLVGFNVALFESRS